MKLRRALALFFLVEDSEGSMNGMNDTKHHGFIFLLMASLFSACQTADIAENEPHFPVPDRPVAKIISPAYSDEQSRDQKGESDLVLDRLDIKPGIRVGDIGAGAGYYTVRVARRLGRSRTIYAQDVTVNYLKDLEARLKREQIQGVKLVLGTPRDPKLPPNTVDVAILSHMYHEIENPYEFFYRLRPALAPEGRVAIIDLDKPTQDHGTRPALLRCELGSLGYRQVDFTLLWPADGYLAVFVPPVELPAVSEIKPCVQ